MGERVIEWRQNFPMPFTKNCHTSKRCSMSQSFGKLRNLKIWSYHDSTIIGQGLQHKSYCLSWQSKLQCKQVKCICDVDLRFQTCNSTRESGRYTTEVNICGWITLEASLYTLYLGKVCRQIRQYIVYGHSAVTLLYIPDCRFGACK